MKKKTGVCLIVILVALLLSGCSGRTAQTNAPAGGANKLFTIRVASQTGFSETPIAEELGYFKEEGIQIQYTGVIKSGVSEMQTVAEGINDAFVGTHPSNVAQGVLAGMKVKAVAPGMVDDPGSPHVRYLVRDDSPIKSLKDIIGKKVGITSYSVCTNGYLQLWLKQNNLPLNVNWVVLPTAGQQEQALAQGLIDVATSHPPFAGIALKQGGIRQIATSYDIVKSPAAGLSIRGFNEQFIAEHPDVVRGFCRALYKARVWINAHPKEAAAMTAKRLKLDPTNVTVFHYDEDKTINPSYIDTWFKMSEQLGLWKEGDIKPADIYTNAYAPQ